ncbi:MAG TPA: molybdopterin-dependent oxidoreductase [Candidatus Limnocylindria bacterium]|nr:molybdopterin-dependent oxidoreductase [Candidatus Limnocylindria bacterium]
MTSAALDRLLAVLVAAMAATGLLTLRAGTPDAGWLFTLHGALAGLLLVTVLVKVRRSAPKAAGRRRWGRLVLGLLVAMLASASMVAGYAWVASGDILAIGLPAIGSVTVLTLHVWIGLVLLPILVLHLLPRRWRLLRPGRRLAEGAFARLLTRRSLLAGLGLLAVSTATFAGVELVDRWRGGVRRFTGSRWLAAGALPPSTTFFGEPTPNMDLDRWRLRVAGRVARPADYTLADLRALGERDVRATLDCTSGWALDATWRGVSLETVLARAGIDPRATTVDVRSVTGWTSSFPIGELAGLLLATGVAGGTLPAGNGAPCRLVAPSRRGLDWVKWIAEVRVT